MRSNSLATLRRRALSGARIVGMTSFVIRQLRTDLRDLTMVEPRSLVVLMDHIDTIIREQIPGAVVECGTWKGGASFLMARRLSGRRIVYMFDSFEGLPAPRPTDASAETLAKVAALDNLRVEVEVVEKEAERLGVAGSVRIVKGLFQDTLPKLAPQIGRIALLRIDGDLYESVRCCLDVLGPHMSPGGYVVVDDYFSWPGATLAVHDYLSENRLAYPIHFAARAEFFFRWGGAAQALRHAGSFG